MRLTFRMFAGSSRPTAGKTVSTSHTRTTAAILAAGLAMAAFAAPGTARADSQPARITGMAHIAYYVTDLQKARDYYEGFLGFAEAFDLKNPDGSVRVAFIKITDASNSAVVGATVKVRNTATNQIRTTETGPTGDYAVADLPAGVFDVTITKAGFQKIVQTNLELAAEQKVRLDETLRVGSQTTTVSVTADVGLLDTETSSEGDVVTPIEVNEMPLNGRDFNDLAFTVVGVQPAEQRAKGAPYVANGSRADSSGVYLDGINDENPRDAGSQISPPLDSLQEFKMATSDYTAQYGRLSGSVVNMVTKSGTNQFHGSLFDFVRNDLFDAPTFDFSTVSIPKNKLRQNQFGGDFNGPMLIPHLYNGRNRTFFLLSLESRRNVTGEDDYGIVPTLLEREGDFSQSLNGQPYYFHNPAEPTKTACAPPASTKGCLYPAPYDVIPTIDPVAQKLLSYIPKPTIPGAQPGQNNYLLITDSIGNWNNGLLRIDQKLSNKDQISGRWLRRFAYSTNPTAGSDLGGIFGATTTSHEILLGVNETHIFSPHLVNNFVYGLTRTRSAELADSAGTNYAQQLGIFGTATDPSIEDFPIFKISGYENVGDNASDPITYVVNDFDGSDVATWNWRRHTLTFGGDILHVQVFQPTNTGKNGEFSYNGKFTSPGTSNALADFMAGYPDSTVLMTGGHTNHLSQTNYAGFVQDDYNVTPHLTLNLGLRYELQTLPTEENGQLASFDPGLQQIVYSNASAVPNINNELAQAGLTSDYVSAQQAGLPQALVNVNPLRFSPRVGFAFRPFGNDKTVIRGGYGIFYTGIRLLVIRTNLAGVFPFSETATHTAVSPSKSSGGSGFISTTNPFPAAGGKLSGILTPNGYDPNAPSAELQSYNLTIERDLGNGIGISVAYVGSKGTHLGQETDWNQERVENTNSSRPLTQFQAITMAYFNGISHYDSGQVTVHRRFQHGLFFRASYTFGRSRDSQSGVNYGGGGGYFGNQNVLDPRAEYGLSDFDIRHTFTATSVYRVSSRHFWLRDWQGSGDILAYSGQPFTPIVSGKQDLAQPTRPNRNCNGAISNRGIGQWFNASCFAVPPSGTFGDSGRNILEGPDSVTLNLALAKIFTIGERNSFEFRLEGFNALNHPSFGYPTRVIGSSTTPGVISSINGNMREVQISGRYSF